MSEIRNVVLVHGAFADGSGWQGVYDSLVADGFNVRIVQNPMTTLQGDVAMTTQQDRGLRWSGRSRWTFLRRCRRDGNGHPCPSPSLWCTSPPLHQTRASRSIV